MGAHRRPPHTAPGRAARAGVLSAAAGAVAVLTVVPVAAEPGGSSSSTAATERVDELFADAERAVEAYNGTSERVEELRAEVEQRQDQLARGQAEVNSKRHSLGSLAAAQYRSGGVDPEVALMLSEDPEQYLGRVSTLDRITTRQAGELRELRTAQRLMEQRRAEAEGTLGELEREKSRLARQKQEVQEKLAAARRQLERLSTEERRERERAARSADREAREAREDRASGAAAASGETAPVSAVPASGRAGAAVSAVRQALGKPYVWGQTGPNGFDCSGLMQWAYARAGVSLPRTSQAQAGAGRRVPLSQVQPGDLVVYRSDASHIGMYVGGGQVVHAPYPGTQVRYDPVGMMPVSGVVRP
ncbi:NlpC/P60 family protein [Streptomyces sp. ACA25]|uniref:C40 family peptidase n=1 Tax=Streptomyces sp. ACA25 TaxID=3022596 RepID=UPI002306FE5E|nr:C40 family peptidase [Streptomyces sp. ACA25]MDB1089912.1 NlpC/P60 family protein [Streptomyces sp. ACA25]